MQLTAKDRMYTKANLLKKNVAKLTPAEFMLQYNTWDKEMTDLMIASENKCRKIKTDSLSWSPVIGTYLRHLNIYRWIVRHKQGHKTNLRNL